jgi:hypothetical protein
MDEFAMWVGSLLKLYSELSSSLDACVGMQAYVSVLLSLLDSMQEPKHVCCADLSGLSLGWDPRKAMWSGIEALSSLL